MIEKYKHQEMLNLYKESAKGIPYMLLEKNIY
jgi:hypothetical protein